ncbi:putative histone-lysine n-methyltransferase setb1 [Fasciolopsis buskii]|uniref:Putative histone-lysine n-methyltransferase setb1 n=1 Tax=Fasciolopsis buskii TaxID=27845 RepID=A0A8E0RPC6_9TREM|nr:putative histone-lysine n-methyltransferase setb1 [Fasciolopsis buski]
MEVLFHENIPLADITEQLEGCSCETLCCSTSPNECPCRLRSTNPYNAQGILTNFSASLFECNSDCLCGTDCSYRLVQTYLDRLTSFPEGKADHRVYRVAEIPGLGKGLMAARDIFRGEVVCAYLGEVVPPEVGVLRERAQLEQHGRTYVLTMREYARDRLIAVTCIDGDADLPTMGKPDARFINHSCDPNMTVIPLRVDNGIPYAVLFASRFIPRDTELTFNYADGILAAHRLNSCTQCQCNTATCMGYLPHVR